MSHTTFNEMDNSLRFRQKGSGNFFLKIVMPAVLAMLLFVLSVYMFILPAFESNAIEQKRTMLHELTNTAWSILQKYHNDHVKGLITKQEAQLQAVEEVKALRYGLDKKDYFWITDLEPRMIMHPYVEDLTGKNLYDYVDPDGKQLFIEAARIAKDQGEGFIRYKWQFKDDPLHIVPKLSFVKRFEPWEWVIGTGIYLDDVQHEIAQLKMKLIIILGGISLIIAMLIAFTTIQSHNIERNRLLAEQQLHESREKYKSLIESSTEGIILLLSQRVAYSNLFIRSWTGYSESELASMNISELIHNGDSYLLEAHHSEHKMEVKLKKKDGSFADAVLTMLPIEFAGKNGLLITLKDIAEHYTVKTELENYRARFEQLSNKLPVGIIRFPLLGRDREADYNFTLAKILGYAGPEELRKVSLIRILGGKQVYKSLLKELLKEKSIENKSVSLVRKDGSEVQLWLTLMLVLNELGAPAYCDGIVKTDKEEEVRYDNTLAQSFYYLLSQGNLPALRYAKDACMLDANASLSNAVDLLRNSNTEVVLVMMQQRCIGMISDKSLKHVFLNSTLDINRPAAEIMTAPVTTALESCSISEAFAIMETNKVSHLVLVNIEESIIGVLSKSDLAGLFIDPFEKVMQIVNKSRDFGMFSKLRYNVPYFAASLMDTLSAFNITMQTISGFDAIITKRVVELCINELGPPPVPFSFIVFGGAGRNELAFNSDQDNALIYADVENEKAEVVGAYFGQLAQKINKRLDLSGLQYCSGKYMANNPIWCQPLKVWKNYFTAWINQPEPENILNFSVFFDMEHFYGDQSLFDSLEDFIYHELKGKSAFYYFLAQTAANVKPPINLFGNLITESTSRNEENVDVKQAISIIVMYTRTFSLYHQIREKSTLGRLKALQQMNVLSEESYEEADFHFRFLMHQRLKIQSSQMLKGKKPDNNLNVKRLSEIEQMILKKVFSQMVSYQSSLSAAFMSSYKG